MGGTTTQTEKEKGRQSGRAQEQRLRRAYGSGRNVGRGTGGIDVRPRKQCSQATCAFRGGGTHSCGKAVPTLACNAPKLPKAGRGARLRKWVPVTNTPCNDLRGVGQPTKCLEQVLNEIGENSDDMRHAWAEWFTCWASRSGVLVMGRVS